MKISVNHQLRRSWVFPSNSSILKTLRNEISVFLSKCRLSQPRLSRFVLCIDEAAANIIEHSNEADHDLQKSFTIEAILENSMLLVRLRDGGQPFDPTHYQEIDLKTHLKKGLKGGLGIHIMRQLLDRFEYQYEQGYNVCTLGIRTAS